MKKNIKIEKGFVFWTEANNLLIITKVFKNGSIYAKEINGYSLKRGIISKEIVEYDYDDQDVFLGKCYLVYGVIDKNNQLLDNQTSFYFNKDYAKSSVRQMNASIVEKNKPYKTKEFYLFSF